MKSQNVQYLNELKVALNAAMFAGDYFCSQIDSERVVKIKSSAADLVTEVDPFCENLIRETILRNFKNDFILGEESVAPGAKAAVEAISEASTFERLWIVDPLDGTNNFISRIPLSVVSIAFAEGGLAKVGVIYDPYRKEVFFAIREFGAFIAKANEVTRWLSFQYASQELPGVKMRVSNCTEFEQSIVATGFPVRGNEKEWATNKALEVSKLVRSFRAMGAAALHLAYVASGRLDLFWEYELNAWDIAAGMLLVEEAGGIVKSMKNENGLLMRDILACCTEKLADTFGTVFLNHNLKQR